MNKIEKLIEELCPQGVEFRALGEIGQRNKGINITATRMKKIHQENAPIKIFAGGKTVANISYADIDSKSIITEPSIIVKSRGYIGFEYYEQPFSHKNELWSYTINSSQVNQKFVFYYLLTQTERLQRIARATSVKIPQLSISDTDRLSIPIPPLTIQKEIVKILDNFTPLEAKLKAELEAELEARKKQYEHYREALLSFGDECEWTKLNNVAEIGTGSSNTNEGLEEGLYPFFVRSQIVRYKNSFEFDETAIITSGDGVGVGKIFHYVNGKYALHQRAYRISITKNCLDSKFLFYYMKTTFGKYILGNAVNSSVTSVRRPMLNKYPVPIPPLAKQQEIVTILDKFDALVNDISTGLPAEIVARKKQYQYYRNQLLNFKPLEAQDAN